MEKPPYLKSFEEITKALNKIAEELAVINERNHSAKSYEEDDREQMPRRKYY